jgi:nitrate/nitrite transporter NarK
LPQFRLADVLEPADRLSRLHWFADLGQHPGAAWVARLAAAGIATINSVGNISGYLAPQLVGVLRDLTGTYAAAMLVVGGMVLVAAALLPLGAAARLSALETRPARV